MGGGWVAGGWCKETVAIDYGPVNALVSTFMTYCSPRSTRSTGNSGCHVCHLSGIPATPPILPSPSPPPFLLSAIPGTAPGPVGIVRSPKINRDRFKTPIDGDAIARRPTSPDVTASPSANHPAALPHVFFSYNFFIQIEQKNFFFLLELFSPI